MTCRRFGNCREKAAVRSRRHRDGHGIAAIAKPLQGCPGLEDPYRAHTNGWLLLARDNHDRVESLPCTPPAGLVGTRSNQFSAKCDLGFQYFRDRIVQFSIFGQMDRSCAAQVLHFVA